MSMQPNNHDPSRLSFTSRCLPGSVAEKQEQERMAEFHRQKALRKAEEARNKPEADAQRNQAYQEAYEANQERMRQHRASRNTRDGFRRA